MIHLTPYTLHPSPYTLNRTPYILHTIAYTPHTESEMPSMSQRSIFSPRAFFRICASLIGGTTQLNMHLSSKVSLPHAIVFKVFCGTNLVTWHPIIGGYRNFFSQPCGGVSALRNLARAFPNLLSSKLGTNKEVKTGFWPWLEPFSVQKSLNWFQIGPSCSAAAVVRFKTEHPRTPLAWRVQGVGFRV